MRNDRIHIIDNFLPSNEFKPLQDMMMGHHLAWYYSDGTITYDNPKGSFQFSTGFYEKGSPHIICNIELLSEKIKCCLDRLMEIEKVEKLYRIKANLNPKTLFHRGLGYHTDGFENGKTAILYVNTNNGWTHIKKCGKIKCVANRIVIFDCRHEHQGYTCTDQKARFLINFNYS